MKRIMMLASLASLASLAALAGCAGVADVRQMQPRFTAVVPANFADLAACMAEREMLSGRAFQVTPIVHRGQGRATVSAGHYGGWAGYLAEYEIEITRQTEATSLVALRLRNAPFEREKRTRQIADDLAACAPGWSAGS